MQLTEYLRQKKEEKGILLVKYNETFSKLKKQYDINNIALSSMFDHLILCYIL